MDFLNPFQLLPEEIWETVLELLHDSEDIINTLQAFPELRCVCLGKEYSWLIGDLLPLLFPKYLDSHDIKLCRLVSKRWNKSVEKTLETHPDRLPYKSPRLTRITESHFNYSSLPPIHTNFHQFFLSHSGLPGVENPFPGRCVHFTVNDYQDEVGIHARRLFEGITKSDYLTLCESLPVMRIYGHRIWYMTFEFTSVFPKNSEVLLINLVQSLCGCLVLMPNLKSLKLIAKQFTQHAISKKGKERLLEIFETTSISFLLETLDLSEFYDHNHEFWHMNLVRAFVRHDQVRKLAIQSSNWDSAFKYKFPNLSELSLHLCQKNATVVLKNILEYLNTRSLGKWGIILKDFTDIDDLMKVLVPFKIESLQISSKQIEKSEKDEAGSLKVFRKAFSSVFSSRRHVENCQCFVNSVRFLRVDVTPHLKFTFFKSFPSLTHLTVDFHSGKVNIFDNRGRHPEDSDNVLQTCLYHFYFASNKYYWCFNKVWKEHANLEMLTVNNPDNILFGPTCHQFVSENGSKPFRSNYLECINQAKLDNSC